MTGAEGNAAALAFIGDAVYEMYVRKRVLESGQVHADALHHMAVKYVSAEGQSTALRGIFDKLTEDEKSLVKRARNRKSATKPRNADPVAYKLATAFEALAGHLYLTGGEKRMEEIFNLAFDVIEGRPI